MRKLFLFVSILLPLGYANALNQDSIIDIMQKMSAGLVHIKSENAQVTKGPDALVGDKVTGRIVVVNPLSIAQYSRDGGGVVVDPSGIIVTNAHTVQSAGRIKVTLADAEELVAEPLFIDELSDVAFIRIQPQHPLVAVPLADEEEITLGAIVYNVGTSSLLHGSFTEGRVVNLGTTQPPEANAKPRLELFRINFSVYQGDSGGPVVDAQGRLLGLIVAGSTHGDTISMAVPVNKIKECYLKAAANHS